MKQHLLAGSAFLLSLVSAVAAGLPVSRAPLARGEAKRQPVRLETRQFSWHDKLYDGAAFVSGNKRVIVSGYNRDAKCAGLIRAGMFTILDGDRFVANLHLSAAPAQQLENLDPSDRLTVDAANCRTVWKRDYELPDRDRKATFTVTATGTPDGRILVDYDFGITPEEAASLEKNPPVHSTLVVRDVNGVWNGWGDWEQNLHDRDAIIASGKSALQFLPPRGITNVYNFAKASDPHHFAVTFPKHIVPFCVGYDSAGEQIGDRLVRSVQYHFYPFARFQKHNAAKFPVKGHYEIDLGLTTMPKIAPPPTVGGIDFWSMNAMHVPVRGTYNVLPNGSFEQDFKGWHWGDWGAQFDAAELPREAISDDAKFGRHSLWLRGGQWRVPALVSGPMSLDAGKKYVLSWWSKSVGVKKPVSHNVSIISAGFKGRYFELKKSTREVFPFVNVPADGEWHRFTRTFEIDGFGACVKIAANLGGTKDLQILIDGVQVAPEGAPEAFGEEPFVANLVSSRRYNDLRPGEEDTLAFEVQPSARNAQPSTGSLRIRLFDYYYLSVYDKTFALDGDAMIPLGLKKGELGKGLFIVRMDYECEVEKRGGGGQWTDYARFIVQEPLDGKHATAQFFANHSWWRRVSRAQDFARKFVEWGWNSVENKRRKASDTGVLAETERELGIRNYFTSYGHLASSKDCGDFNASLPPEERLDVLEYRKWTSVTPKHLAFVEKFMYKMALEAEAQDDIWTFAGEEESWVRRPEIGYEAHYELNQAVRRGVAKAFAERRLKPPRMSPTQGTSHYFNGRNYDAIDGYLKTAAAHGYRYDVIAVHPYQNIDGGVQGPKDADLETQHLLAQMREYGYPETTPIYFTESFNMHPTYIPMWGAAGWGDSYRAHTQPSQDMGNYEVLTAASQARICIIGLKFWPRLQMQHTWNCSPALDIRFTPYATVLPPNTLGHLLPSPKYYGDAQPYGDVRGYCFLQDDHAVMPVWTTNHEVEWGRRKGAVLEMELPADVKFVDMCGNECDAEKVEKVGGGGQRTVKVPLTPAPLYLISKDAEGLLKGLREAVADDPSTAISVDVRPDEKGVLNLVLQNETKAEKKGTVKVGEKEYAYCLASRGSEKIPLVTEDTETMKLHSWSSEISLLGSPWELKWFYVPPCGEKPDWEKIPAQPLDAKRGEPRGPASCKMAYNKDFFFLRVEAEDPAYESYTKSGRKFDPANLYAHDGSLEVYFDGFADARAQGTKSYDLNDSRYDFVENHVHRLLAVNWQLAQGTDSATDAEIREKLVRKFTRTEKGYVYEIAFAARYMAPIDLKPGTVAGIGLALHQFAPGKDGKWIGSDSNATRAGYSCNNNPYVWPIMVFK